MDIKSPEARSNNMSAIRSADTKPEIYLRKLLFSHGFRYRKNYSKIYGHPDIYLPKYHTAVFVHGCFWHRHSGCKYTYMPKSNVEFWQSKFRKNQERDNQVIKQLENENIKCLIVWECAIKEMKKDNDLETAYLDNIIEFFNSSQKYMEIP
ncbi:MAG: very short patch repair endonuclease [Lachnospiraceae bacterium]